MSGYSYVLDIQGRNRPDVLRRDDGVPCFLVTQDPDGLGAQAWIAAGNVPGPAVVTVTGNQWAFALSSLGLSSAWRIGVTRSKDSDQVRVGLIARDTPLVASDPLLIRVAANAGTDSSGNPLIVVATVFASAQGMPL